MEHAWSRKAPRGVGARPVPAAPRARAALFALEPLTGDTHDAPRLPSGIAEFDRVTGGGFVARLRAADRRRSRHRQVDAADPGRARRWRERGHRAVYISGEEAVAQVRLRAERLGLADAPVELAAETSVEDILATLSAGPAARASSSSIRSRPCGPTRSTPRPAPSRQVRGSAQALIRFAKTSGAAVMLVGHVTKDGQIAGPRVVEHMVDAVLYFEGEGAHHFRILRAVKNRFGPTDEIGVFEMTGAGLREVANPSALFLGRARRGVARHRRVRRHGGHAAAAGRNPGAGRADLARHAAPRRGRLGYRAGCDGARRAGGALRGQARRPRRLSQRRRRPCASTSRPPTSPRRRRWSRRSPARRCPPTPSISARSRCPARCARSPRPPPG